MASPSGKKVRYLRPSPSNSHHPQSQNRDGSRKIKRLSHGEKNHSLVKGRAIPRPKKRAREDSPRIESTENRCRFLSLPVELVFLVCQDLEPMAILHLSRVTKWFRALLLSSENLTLWRKAVERVKDLPRCPPDLSCPAYVSFMFETSCQGCLSHTAKTDYLFRLRLCDTCTNDHTVTKSLVQTAWPGIPERLMKVIPRSATLGPGLDALYVRQLVIDAKLALDEKEKGSSAYYNTLDDICQALSKLDTMLRKTGKEMQAWANRYGTRRRYILCQERIERISRRLSELGWNKADLPPRWDDAWNDDLSTLVFCPEPLTDRAWGDLYPKLVPLLERGKKRRLRREAQDCLNTKRKVVWEYFEEWLKEQPTDTPHLSPRNLCAVSAVAKLVKSSNNGTVSKDLWIKNLSKVAAANRAHQEKIVAALRLVLVGHPHPQKIRNIEMGKDPFEDLHVDFDPTLELNTDHLLASTAAFFCATCRATLWFPGLLTHRCCLVEPWAAGSFTDTAWLGPTFYTAKLQAAAQICCFIPRIVEDVGLSSEVTRAQAMIAGKVYLCLRCDDLVAQLMSYDELVEHYINECRWYQSVSSWVSKRTASPISDNDDALPVFRHTHGDKDQRPLACVATTAQLARLRITRFKDRDRQNALIQHLDAEEPESGYGDWSSSDSTAREQRRTCNLCPNLGKLDLKDPLDPVKMEVHIRTRHAKTPDLLKDSKRFGRY